MFHDADNVNDSNNLILIYRPERKECGSSCHTDSTSNVDSGFRIRCQREIAEKLKRQKTITLFKEMEWIFPARLFFLTCREWETC